jgi:hypothetical protein
MPEEALKSQSQANGAAGVNPRDVGWRRWSSHQRSRSVDKRAVIDGGDDYADETRGMSSAGSRGSSRDRIVGSSLLRHLIGVETLQLEVLDCWIVYTITALDTDWKQLLAQPGKRGVRRELCAPCEHAEFAWEQ